MCVLPDFERDGARCDGAAVDDTDGAGEEERRDVPADDVGGGASRKVRDADDREA